MKLTKEILIKLDFVQKGQKWTKWKLDLWEEEIGVFSFDESRIYVDIETVEHLHNLWKVIGAEEDLPLEVNAL
tara:strand:+ start:406 stop:624 length:219 start_codon:yes stop_codon:yes gene_type:complete